MAKLVVEDIIETNGFKVTVEKVGSSSFNIVAEDPAPLIALMLKRQRLQHGFTVREVTARAGYKTPSVIAAYENGTRTPGFGQLQKLLNALGSSVQLKVG